MKAVVMAGGVGSRLYPLTANQPKPMVSLVNRPTLAHILGLLSRHCFTEVVITVRHLADQIQTYFGDGRFLGLKLHYVVEDTPLGTAGGIKIAQEHLSDEPFLVISSDISTNLDLTRLVKQHQASGATASLALKQVPDPRHYGMVVTDSNGQIRRYVEKPRSDQAISNLVNLGIYILSPQILDYVPENKPTDFSHDVFPALLADGRPMFGNLAEGYWRDIGTFSNYYHASADILSGKVGLRSFGANLGGQVWAGRDVEIAADAKIFGPVYLGRRVIVESGATIYGPTVISNNTVVDRKAWIDRSIIGQDNFVGEAASISSTITAEQTVFAANSLTAGQVIGYGVRLPFGTGEKDSIVPLGYAQPFHSNRQAVALPS